MNYPKSTQGRLRTTTLTVLITALLVWPVLIGADVGAQRDPKVTCKVETDRGVLPANAPQKVVVKVTLGGAFPEDKSRRPPVNLAIVLDRSGSMTGEKLHNAKEAAIEALKRLSPRDVFSVVVYDHIVETVAPAQRARNLEEVASRIRRIQARGNTALFAGVSQGAAEIRKNLDGKYFHRIILLSDGLANVGPSTPEDLARLGAALLKEDISVTTVGVGTDYNEDLMAALAKRSDGNTYFVESANDLPRIFSAELGDVLSVVAKKAEVIIECPDGVKPLRIIGRDGRIRGRTAEVSLHQLYGKQEKHVFIEMEVSAEKSGKEMEIASARVSYVNPIDGKRAASLARARARFSDDRAEVDRSVNMSVQEDFAVNLSAVAQERAISLADKGKTDEAVEVLNRSADAMHNMGKIYNNKTLLERAQQIRKQAGQIAEEGMTRRQRKVLRTDSYQIQQQQAPR